MKVVILAGGLGTRLAEETDIRPKPMVEIGGIPILEHIMKIYSSYGFKDFIICLGYKGEYIIDYFTNNPMPSDWKLSLVNTGDNTMTGGRIKRIKEYIGNEDFMLTYGDGVADIDINKLVEFHKNHKKLLTITAVQPTGRFGGLKINHETGMIEEFNEKPKGDGIWINGGFFICKPEIFSYIDEDETTFEQEPINRIVEKKELMCYKHHGFWKCMDTLKDKNDLNKLWKNNQAKWKTY
jgi:glucose-1-phosphate cytidylyltransferase